MQITLATGVAQLEHFGAAAGQRDRDFTRANPRRFFVRPPFPFEFRAGVRILGETKPARLVFVGAHRRASFARDKAGAPAFLWSPIIDQPLQRFVRLVEPITKRVGAFGDLREQAKRFRAGEIKERGDK